ncbi:MAG: hypothetical protein RLY35_1741, partial [Bacteroidota bacterium]
MSKRRCIWCQSMDNDESLSTLFMHHTI